MSSHLKTSLNSILSIQNSNLSSLISHYSSIYIATHIYISSHKHIESVSSYSHTTTHITKSRVLVLVLLSYPQELVCSWWSFFVLARKIFNKISYFYLVLVFFYFSHLFYLFYSNPATLSWFYLFPSFF